MIMYSKKETKYLFDRASVDSSETIAIAVSEKFGSNRTACSVNQKLARMGKRKPRVGNYTAEETVLIETFIDVPDADEMVKQLTEKFGARHSRASIISKRAKLRHSLAEVIRSTDIKPDRAKIIVRTPEQLWEAKRIVISTLQLVNAMTDAGIRIDTLARKLGLAEQHVYAMLTRTGVSKEYAPRIRAALGMTR